MVELANKIHLKKFYKFLILILILFVYTFFMIRKYGAVDGPLVSLTTWSFFVFCTPLADAGFLIDFPIRILTGFKMMYSEMIVWLVALIITLYSYFFAAQIFDNTFLLDLYYHILNNLFPYGLIIILSGIGTFFSIYFAEELLTTSINGLKRVKYEKHNLKHKTVLFIFVIAIIIGVYYYLLSRFDIEIPFLYI